MRMASTRGFTLTEVLVVLVLILVLAGIGAGLYRGYLASARDAQTVENIEVVREAVRLENLASSHLHLSESAVAGKVPPALAHRLDDKAFHSTWDVEFRLMDFPPGFFESHPAEATYGLVATPLAAAGAHALDQVQDVLVGKPGDAVWLSDHELAFPLVAHESVPVSPVPIDGGVPVPTPYQVPVAIPQATPPLPVPQATPPQPVTQAPPPQVPAQPPVPPAAIPVQVPAPQPPIVAPLTPPQPMANATPARVPNLVPTATPAAIPPAIPAPQAAVPGTGGQTAGGGAVATGSAGAGTAASAGAAGSSGFCPPGYAPAGQSGHCHPDHRAH